MNKNILIQSLNQANQNAQIELMLFNKSIELVKKYIDYNIQDKTLIIDDMLKNEQYIININSIKLIKFVNPKINPMGWFGSGINTNNEVKKKMSI